MTIQLSVTIWTVICFAALMVILDRLLFRPLLDFMDRRREKIDGTRAARRAALEEREQELHRWSEEQLAARKHAMEEASAALEAMREENGHRLAERKAEYGRRLALQREALEEESQTILASLDSRTASLSAIFTEKFLTPTYRELNTSEEDETAAPHAEVEPEEDAKTDE